MLKEIEVKKIIAPGNAATTAGLGVDRGAQRVQHQAPFGDRAGRTPRPRNERPEARIIETADEARRIDEDRPEHIAEHVDP